MSLTLTKNEFSDLCGIGIKTVNQWIGEGLPKETKVIGGRRRVIIDRTEAAKWLWGKRRYRYAKAMTQPTEGEPIVGDSKDKTRDALARARAVEREAYSMLQRCGQMEKMALQEHYMKCADQLRKLENDWAGIQQSRGEVIPRAEVEKTMVDMATAIKNDFLALPDKLAGQCEMLPACEIKVKVQEAVVDCLRHLGAG